MIGFSRLHTSSEPGPVRGSALKDFAPAASGSSRRTREADLSSGTVFYLYSSFNGSILTDVLSALRMESTRRSIKICSLALGGLADEVRVADARWV
jgi:hypothetical protein